MYFIRPIQSKDNQQIAQIIRQVSQEFGLAPEAGFAVADPILDHLYEVYQQPNSQYWVIVDEHDNVFGGGGIVPLQGDTTLLEIQKMYFLAEIRGQGLARQLLQQCFNFAQQHQFSSCYLETTASLFQAVKLYEKLGFIYLDQPKGHTGHSTACEIWMLKSIGTK